LPHAFGAKFYELDALLVVSHQKHTLGFSFYPHDIVSAVLATATWLAGCHTPVMCLKSWTYLKTFATVW